MSWSQISSFYYNVEDWHSKYILNIKDETVTPELEFGKIFAKSCEDRKPLAPVTLYSVNEFELKAKFDGIQMIGYLDTYEPLKAFIDHKTGKKEWTHKRASEHGQLKMYALMLYLLYKVKPEDLSIGLEWIPTKKEDNKISFIEPITVHHFDVKITMQDILLFGNYIQSTVKKMERYAQAMS